ncbi:hypothetical protein L9F63_019693, partial [Diploptera punctata]
MGKAEQHFEERTDAGIGSPHSEASKMLEAALQQMDGIISETEQQVHIVSDSPNSSTRRLIYENVFMTLLDFVSQKQQVFFT